MSKISLPSDLRPNLKMFQKEILEDISDHVEGYYKVMGKPSRFDTEYNEEVVVLHSEK